MEPGTRSRSRRAIGLLAVLLVASNLMWAYQAADQAVTLGYKADVIDEYQRAGRESLAVLRESAKAESTRESVITAACAAAPGGVEACDPFEDDGLFVVDVVGIQFDTEGHVVEVEADFGDVR